MARLTGWRVPAALLSVALSGLGHSAGGAPPRITDVVLKNGMLLAADWLGHLVILDSEERALTLWDRRGEQIGSCAVAATQPLATVNSIALRDDTVLLSYFSPQAGREEERVFDVFDMAECKVSSTFSLPGVSQFLQGAPDGWLVTARNLDAASFIFELIRDSGKPSQEFAVPTELQARIRAKASPNPGASVARLVAVRNDVWLVPSGSYELWFPKQKGRSERVVAPPPCLAAEGRALSGKEAEDELLARVANASDETKKMMQAFVERSRAGAAAPMSGYVGAVSAVASYDRLLAVAVRAPPEASTHCRVDVWDTSIDSLVAVVPTPGDRCAGFLAVSDDALLVWQKEHLKRFTLPSPLVPLSNPCAGPNPSSGQSQAGEGTIAGERGSRGSAPPQ